jgi:hypothetical protein
MIFDNDFKLHKVKPAKVFCVVLICTILRFLTVDNSG